MTRNQIEYWKLVEDKRHNQETERENNRSNVARESENTRTNVANESIKRQANLINQQHFGRSDQETNRHNIAMEQLQDQANQAQREKVILGYAQTQANRDIAAMQTALGYGNLSELTRSNMAREQENTRHNTESEYVQNRNVSVDRINALTKQQEANTRADTLAFQKYQYDTTGRALQQAQTRKTAVDSVLVGSEIKRNAVRNAVDVVNATSGAVRTQSDVLGAGSRIINNLSKLGGILQ